MVGDRMFDSRQWSDWRTNARQALSEYASATSESGHVARAAYLWGASISDALAPQAIGTSDISFGFNGIALNATKLHLDVPEPRVEEAVPTLYAALQLLVPTNRLALGWMAGYITQPRTRGCAISRPRLRPGPHRAGHGRRAAAGTLRGQV